MLVNGWINKFYIEIDPSGNETVGRVINIENGNSAEAKFIEQNILFKDLKTKYPIIILDKDKIISDKDKEINGLKSKLSFFENKIKLTAIEYEQYKTL